MKNEKIVAAIAAYLEKQTRPCDVTSRVEYGHYEFLHRGASSNDLHAGFCREVAEKLAAAIAPYLEAGAGEQVKDLQVGAHVKIVAKIDTGDRFSHHFQIGHLGTITRVDLSDPLYQYLIDDHDYGWVLADEIELIG